jgi:adenosine kinase
MELGILVIGKIAYGLQFSITDNFNILTEERTDNYQTIGNDVSRIFRGMAANVAYGLSLFGVHPTIVSQVGYDFDWHYRPHFEKLGIELRVFIDQERETACFYIIQDLQGDYLAINQDNSYRFFAERELKERISPKEFQNFSVVFIGTGKAEADKKFISYVHEQNQSVPLIFCPDGNIKELTKWRLTQILEKTAILLCTEEELKSIEKQMKQNREEILANLKRLKYIVSFTSRERIIIYSSDYQIKVSEGPSEEVISTKNWRDAFIAGIVYGVSLKKPIEEAAKLGSALASYAAEKRQFQRYSPSSEQIALRSFEVKTIRKSV